MNRYEAINARARILTYYNPRPYEMVPGENADAFKRAKDEWIKHAKQALKEVEEMTLESFNALRDEFKARKPDECFECGQLYRREVADHTQGV